MAASRARPTLKSIAAELGVSRTTISNAYNHPERLSDELRERVFQLAADHGYRGPDPLARKLRTRRAAAVGLVFTDSLSYAIRDAAASGFLEGVARSCEEAEMSLLLIPTIDTESARLTALEEAAVDGMIAYSLPDRTPAMEIIRSKRVPLVVVDEPEQFEGADWVGLDEEASFGNLATHLAELGHRRVVVLCHRLTTQVHNGPVDFAEVDAATYSVQRKRLKGFAAAFARATSGTGQLWIEESYLSEVPAGFEAADAILDRYPTATAIACTSDALALGALIAANRRGLRIPTDISITGFDDIAAAARAGLTTVRQPVVDKGRTAGELLFSPSPGGQPRRRVLPTTLEVRASSGPPPAGL